MDSRHSQRSHLDLSDGREVVLCHACSYEWYREDHGLTCPSCSSEVTEIIDPENDPREFDHHHSSASTSPERQPERSPTRQPHSNDDSDPDEDDIDEHMTSHHGFTFNRSTRNGPGRQHHNPNLDPTINRFIDMVNGFGPVTEVGGPRHVQAGRINYSEQIHQTPGRSQIHRATFTNSSIRGGASVTIFSTPMSGGVGRGQTPGPGRHDPFQEIFASMMRDIGPPPGPDEEGGPPAFLRGLQDIIGLLNPANAVAGDAVYSQEALDRIISNLMETNPQSNAAPPATDEALKKLERRPVDTDMLDGESKVECPICIDDMKEGDTAVFLPCKHWFHEDCVVLWLKEHNTCPICRTAIEKNEPGHTANRQGGQSGAGGSGSPGPSQGGSQRPISPRGLFGGYPGYANPSTANNDSDSSHHTHTPLFGGSMRSGRATASPPGEDMYDAFFNSHPPRRTPVDEPYPSSQLRAHRSLRSGASRPSIIRPPSQGQSRLNEVLRSVSSLQERQRDRDEATTTGYDTSRFQRRNSLSPTSPRVGAEQTSRVRQRSPSQGSGQWANSDREAQRSTGGGPLNWIRNRFSSSGSGSSSAREERRR